MDQPWKWAGDLGIGLEGVTVIWSFGYPHAVGGRKQSRGKVLGSSSTCKSVYEYGLGSMILCWYIHVVRN
jgi:hypothetical protein